MDLIDVTTNTMTGTSILLIMLCIVAAIILAIIWSEDYRCKPTKYVITVACIATTLIIGLNLPRRTIYTYYVYDYDKLANKASEGWYIENPSKNMYRLYKK